MDQIVLQGKNIAVLKALNNAIVTTRLYPPESPQVANAVEIGYKGLKLFLREQGSLRFSLEGGSPHLCGQPLKKEILDSFPNLVIFRQLRLLGLSQLVIGPEMDRLALAEIISVFNMPIEKAKKAGGGLALVNELGLASYFPEQSDIAKEKEPVKVSAPAVANPRKLVVKVRPELIACLCGMDKKLLLQEELKMILAKNDTAIDLLAAAVGHILQDIQRKGVMTGSPLFPTMLRGAEAVCNDDNRQSVTFGLAHLLVENLRGLALCVLLSQEFPEGLGSMLYDALLRLLSMEKLSAIFVLFREQIAKARQTDGDKSDKVEFLGKAMYRLMHTDKGKQLLSAEKARTMIHEGEAARKKRRLEAGLQAVFHGNLNPLKSDELLQYLPEVIIDKLESGNEKDAETLTTRIAAYLGEEANNTAMESVITIGERLFADGRFDLVDIILGPIMEAIRKASNESLLEKAVSFLHKVMQDSWHTAENNRGDAILAHLYMIRCGQVETSPALIRIIGKIQDKGIKRATLAELLAKCLQSPMDEAVGYRIALQGPIAVRFLVESMINADKMEDRVKIIDLLTTNSGFVKPILLEKLPEPMPWHGKRNLLKLLGETGQEMDAENVFPFLKHEDFRVQREAFLCLYRIGGKGRKRLLLLALNDCSEVIKIQIISALSGLCDQDVATELTAMLETYENFSEKNRADIFLQLLDTLGRCTCPAALKGVESFLQTRGQRSAKKIPQLVWNAAEKAVAQLGQDLNESRKKHLQAGQLRKNALKQAAKLSKTGSNQRTITGLPQEQSVRALLLQGDKAGAGNLLMQLIEKTARMHNFPQAENLRQWFIEINPTDLSDIIRISEIINREKEASIDKGHLEIWNRLYECLTSEEFATVYHAQQHKEYVDGEVVVSQGSMQSLLFFINRGKVKLYFLDKEKEVLVKTLGSGEIFGAGAFFNPSVWTISAASLGSSEISSLKLDKLRNWSKEFPSLETKLQEFCNNFENIEDFIKTSSQDRRTQERYKISGRVSTALLDNHGQSIGVNAEVELSDISIIGIAYRVRISKKDNARIMLGRKVQVQLPITETPGEISVISGDILAVTCSYAEENEYSVHVKFDTALDTNRVQEIVGLMSAQSQAE
jgi:CRP-like cAMP-binding protein